MTRCPRCQRRFPASGECESHGRPTALVDVTETAQPPSVVAPAGWRLAEHIATGGMAHVFKLERANQPAGVLKWGRYRERDIHARFEVEAEVLRAVGPPAAPAFYELGQIDQWPYLVMEHVSGETLAKWMSRNGARGGLGEVLAILTRIASALAVLHDAGYVHRDLKPENIMIGGRGARLLDFGLAKRTRGTGKQLTQIGSVVGTVHYIAPEQIRGIADVRSDIYSFGVIAYEMLTGIPPFVGERRAIEYQHQVVRPPAIRELREVPAELDELVMRCLAKQPEARPQSAAELGAALQSALGALATIRGIGAKSSGSHPVKPVGRQCQVALAWIEGAEPLVATRALAEVQGILVRQRGDSLLAAFTEQQHEAPVAIALAASHKLLEKRCRIVVHLSTALVRRTSQGKWMAYGPDIDKPESWLPTAPFSGLVLTAPAAQTLDKPIAALDVPGFFREATRDRTDATDASPGSAFVGRGPLVANLRAAVLDEPMLIGISGPPGIGKTRVLEALAQELAAAGRQVISVRARRRFPGDRPDDDRVLEALGGADAVERVGANVVLAIDDFDRLSRRMRESLSRVDLAFARIVTSTQPLFEVSNETPGRIAIALPKLSYEDASSLLREQLRPARLIPEVIVERLALRGAGNPALLLGLARDMKLRGAIRRHAGGDWYVAPDELDTLLAPPGPSWLAERTLEGLPPELATLVRICSALGPRFCADEIAHIAAVTDAPARLAWLVTQGILVERAGWFEIASAHLQEAIYEHLLPDRDSIHARACEYWLARRHANGLGQLARIGFHAARVGQHATAAACLTALANEARKRDEPEQVELLLARAIEALAIDAHPTVRDAMTHLD